MRNFVSQRAQEIPPSGIRKFFDLVLTMEDVISLGVGEPDFNTPWNICESGIYSIEQGVTSYTSNRGLQTLRDTLSRYLAQHYNLNYDSNTEMLITTGVSEALDIAIRAITDPGDEILVAQPSYVSYGPCVTLAGGIPVPLRCTEKDHFRINPDSLAELVTKKTKALVISFPNNPTGGVMSESDLRGIADIVIDNDLVLISDEVYAELTYEGRHCSAATVSDLWQRTITLNGFSKAYAMTGWRIGYLCAPEDLCDAALKIHQYIMLCAPVMGQVGALEALRSAEEDKNSMVNEYRQRRNLFVAGLNRIGLPCHVPEGAFYAFPSIEKTGLSDVEFAERLLKEQRVAVVPGSVFGAGGEGHVRCAYAVSRKELAGALERMDQFLQIL
ncbi:MAG: aminotransferase class I/II-fold pyridoxal phosphate-dependent enzyme [Methanoregula sp.]|jgi:aminotransferase|uniref:aminotransferase class I/II-fold pyridoxal phosphate-dependent enzyme n=1 Tax=Methanoregula sp. TaxID=2052170 RepID=UPI0025D42F6E|nr:aminotransferase class I/II-fold pyridoxal phosphate-dependent enzyme [Methanoregula sp.]MCK9631597.1 aminotransferase class I/II-fold pyridoxal phosphate-dependent enzyme [Methanoregula sp.]